MIRVKKKTTPSTGDDRDFASAVGWDLQFSRKMHIASCCISRCVDIVLDIVAGLMGRGRKGKGEKTGRESARRVYSRIDHRTYTTDKTGKEKWNRNGSFERPGERNDRLFLFTCAGTTGNKNKKKRGVEKNEKRECASDLR